MKVFYCCDGFACASKYNGKCPKFMCRHTSNIAHAKNFTEAIVDPSADNRFESIACPDDTYFEKEEKLC